MRIDFSDTILIRVKKKEVKDMHRWLQEQGLLYHSIKENPVKSAIGEFYIQLADFLKRWDEDE